MIEIPGKNTGKSIMPNPVSSPDETRQLNMLTIPYKDIVNTPQFDNIHAGNNITKTKNNLGGYDINADAKQWEANYLTIPVTTTSCTVDLTNGVDYNYVHLNLTGLADESVVNVTVLLSSKNLKPIKFIATSDIEVADDEANYININTVMIDGEYVRTIYTQTASGIAVNSLYKATFDFLVFGDNIDEAEAAIILGQSIKNPNVNNRLTVILYGLTSGQSVPVSVTVQKQGQSAVTKIINLSSNGINYIYADDVQSGALVSDITSINIGDDSATNANVFGIDYSNLPTSASFFCKRCTNLTDVILNPTLTSIPNNAFFGCSSLEDIELPSSITSIGDYAFKLTAIEELVIPNTCTSIGEYAFEGGKLQSITLPNAITKLKTGCFYSCQYLQSITIPNSVTEIENSVFQGCGSLDTIQLPSGLQKIGDYSFYNCGIHNLTLPSTVSEIGDSAFSGGRVEYIHLTSTTPPTVSDNSFEEMDIFVGIGSVESDDVTTYNTYADSWKSYSFIDDLKNWWTYIHTQRVGTMIMRDDNTYWDKYEWSRTWNNRAVGVTFADTNGHNMLIGLSDLGAKQHYSNSTTPVADLAEIKSTANAILDFGSTNNTDKFIASLGNTFAAGLARSYNWLDNGAGDLVSCGQLNLIKSNVTEINQYINLCGGTPYTFDSKYYWTSSYYGLLSSGYYAWRWGCTSQVFTYVSMNSYGYVRPVRALAAINI